MDEVFSLLRTVGVVCEGFGRIRGSTYSTYLVCTSAGISLAFTSLCLVHDVFPIRVGMLGWYGGLYLA